LVSIFAAPLLPIIAHLQATLIFSTSSPIKILRHRFGSEPPTGSEDGNLQPVGGSFNFIFSSPMMFLLDGVLIHFKPTHGEALPHHYSFAFVTLQQFAGDLHSGEVFGSCFVSSEDLDVIGSFLKGPHVKFAG
jgi:hypothetical protein